MCAGVDFSVDNDSASDSGPQCDHHDIHVTFSAAVPLLAESRNIGIVADFHFHSVKKIHEFLFDIDNAPVEVDASVYRSVAQDRTRNTYAHALDVIQRSTLVRQLSFDRIRDIRQNRFPVIFCSGRDFPLVHQSTVRLEKTTFDSRPSDIDSKCIRLCIQCVSFPPWHRDPN